MSGARSLTPGARARRALAVDAALAAALALILLTQAAGLGVVAAISLPLLLLGLVWIGAERVLRRLRSRAPAGRSRAASGR